MADFDTVYQAQNAAYAEIWDTAQSALDALDAAAKYVSIQPADVIAIRDMQTLEFDPGAPDKILLNQGPIALDDILRDVDYWISKLEKITPPTFPNNVNVKMEDHEIWDDAFADQIKGSLSNYITTMGIPDVAYQNSIFNEDYERNLVILNDLYELADAKTGARGFTYTNDFANSLKLDAQVKYQYDRTQVSRSISKLVTEWARQNYQMAIQSGITLEQAHMDFTYKYCTASVEIYKSMIMAELEKYKSVVTVALAPAEAYIKEMQAVLEYVKTSAEIDKTNVMLIQSRSDLEIKEATTVYNTEMSKYQTNTQKAIAELTQKFDAYKQVAQQTASMAQATSNSVIGYAKK